VTSRAILATTVVLAPTATALLLMAVPRALLRAVVIAGAVCTAGVATACAVIALHRPGIARVGDWIVVDAVAGVFVAVIALIGLTSVLASHAFLATVERSLVGTRRRARVYYAVLFVFWATLLAVPLAGNLAAAWLLVEATTAASAFLVGFSGKPRALEAGWKYLILTSLGLGVALLGIGLLAAGVPGGGLSGLTWHALGGYRSGTDAALTAYLLLIVGLAAKIGWAPVHNWLPDAHSEAPAPVSALLSAALLPTVLLIAWRAEQALAPVVGAGRAREVLIGFGLVSLAVAVPFLWQSLAWKRLLAYSSLEHMGVLALGVGFGTPLALAGVVVHVAGHAVAKALGFYAATPLLAHDPRAGGHAVSGIGRTAPALGASMGLALGALAAVPPSPLFVSELLIVAGGFRAGHPGAAIAAIVLLALGFLGLAHALIDVVAGKAHHRAVVPGLRGISALTGAAAVLLLGLVAAAFTLPGSELVAALARGLT
jgi:hydrogenase-4 component F